MDGCRPGEPADDAMERDAVFSPCRTYRYSLIRQWAPEKGCAMVVGLNPSTADESNDDPTIRRCIALARAWGFGRLLMTNLFAYRATQTADLLAQPDPIGPENDQHLAEGAAASDVVVAAWGTHGNHLGRDAKVLAILPRLHVLHLTKAGHPAHPLYLPAGLEPMEWLMVP